MEEAEVGRPTQMDDLQIEMQFAILKLVSWQSLVTARSVCKLWKDIIDEWIGWRKVDIGPNKWLSRRDFLQIKLEEIGEVGSIRELRVNDPFLMNVLEDKPSPCLKVPYLLKELSLEWKIHPDLFRNLIAGTINLTSFVVTYPALEHLRTKDLGKLHFPKLKHLVITRNWKDTEKVPSDSSLIKLGALLEGNHFLSLTSLSIEVIHEGLQELEVLKRLFPFIRRHRVLQDLYVRIVPWGKVSPAEQAIYEEELAIIVKGIRTSGLGHSLRNIAFNSRNGQTLKAWNEFLVMHASVEALELRPELETDADFLRSFCLQNRSTLKRVIMCDVYAVDLSVFSSLERPYSLRLHGGGQLVGAKELSPTVESLTLLNFPMRSNDLEHILLHLPNLRNVFLQRVSDRREGYGVTLDCLQHSGGSQENKSADISARVHEQAAIS